MTARISIKVFTAACLIFSSFVLLGAESGQVREITIDGITDSIPLEYTTASGPKGAYVEIWKLWSKKSGIGINYVIMNEADALRALERGDIQVIMGYPGTTGRAKGVLVIPGIYKADIYIYRAKNLPAVESINELLPYRTGIQSCDLPLPGAGNKNITFVVKGSVADMVESAESGEIIVFLAEEARANHLLLNRGKWKDFIRSAEPVFSCGIHAAVKAGNSELAAMIEGGFSKITDNERLVIGKTWAGGNYKYSIFWSYLASIIAILAVIAGVVAVWWWNFQLHKKIDEATVELKAMKEEAENANMAKSRFLDNISHELRTPLTLILAPVEDAINGRPMSRDILEMVRRNSRSLLSLINDLLDLSRITAGKMKLSVAETDLAAMVKLYCDEMSMVAEYNGITLACAVPGEPIIAFVDRGKFSSLISNIFSNSLKFTGEGGSIGVSLEKEGDDILPLFSDTGPGIHPDMVGTVFNRFSQAGPASQGRHEGTGIGLSIVKEIADLHCGSVSVSSRHIDTHADDHGTEFRVRIPSGREHFSGRADVEFVSPGDGALPDTFARGVVSIRPEKERHGCIGEKHEADTRSILVVEDNGDMLAFLKGLLEGIYEVRTAQNGAEALEMLNSIDGINLVLSDLMMPVMDGNGLLERINSSEKLRGLPVLLLTARNDDIVKHRGLELGAVDYVTKPFNPDELLLRVKNQIQLRVMRNELQRKNDELYTRLKKMVQQPFKKQEVPEGMKPKMESVCRFIAENFRNEISREMVAQIMGMNPDVFSRIFNRHTGKTFPDYINSLRIEEAKRMLADSEMTVSRIAIETGFDNLRTFNRVFRKFTGKNPGEFREGDTTK